MSNSDGYHCLIEDNITMHKPEDSIKQVLPSRTEIAWPANDLDNTWRLARLKGLAPEVTTFMWRLLYHNLLTTQERISRVTGNPPPLCNLYVKTSLLKTSPMPSFFVIQMMMSTMLFSAALPTPYPTSALDNYSCLPSSLMNLNNFQLCGRLETSSSKG